MVEGEASPARRRWPRVVAWSAAGLLAAGAAAVVWRVPLAEIALRAGLSAAGYADATVEIASIGWRALRVARVRAGAEISLADLTVEFDPGRLATRPVTSVRLGRLDLDLTRADGPLGRMMRARPADRTAPPPQPRIGDWLDRQGALPDLAVESWRLRLATGDSDLRVEGGFLSRTVAGGGFSATLSARATATAGAPLRVAARAFLDLDGDRATLTLRAAAPAEGATVDLALTATRLRATPLFEAKGTVTAPDLARLAPLVPPLSGVSGSLRAALRTAAPVAVPPDALSDPGALLALLRRDGALAATVEADRLTLPPGGPLWSPVNASASLDIGLDTAAGRLRARTLDDAASIDFSVTIDDPRGTPTVALDGAARLADVALVAAAPGLAGIHGPLAARLRTVTPVAVPPGPLADPAALAALLRGGAHFAATATAELRRQTMKLGIGARADLDLGRDGASLRLAVEAPDAGAAGTVTATIADPVGTPALSANGEIRLTDLSRLAGAVPALRGMAGRLRLAARTDRPVALTAEALRDGGALSAALRRAAGVTVTLSATDVRRPGLADGVSGSVRATIGRDGDALTAATTLALAARRLGAGPVSARAVRIAGPLRAVWRAGSLDVALPAGLSLSAGSFGAAALSGGRIRATLSGRGGHAATVTLDDGTVDVALDAAIGPSEMVIARAGGPKLALALPALRLSATGGTGGALALALRGAADAELRSADLAARLSGISASARRAGPAAPLRFEARAGLDLASAGKKLFAPLTLAVGGALDGARLGFDARAGGPAGLALSAKGRHDLAAGTGAADIALSTIRFGTGGSRVADLLPGYKGIEPLSGSVGAAGRFGWDGDGLDGNGELAIEGIDVEDPGTGLSIAGLETRIRFAHLVPPVSAPGQVLRVRRIAAGVTLDDLVTRFAVRRGSAPTLPIVALETMRVGFAGGTIGVRDVTFDPGSPVNRAVVRFDGVDLAKLLELAKVKGLTGTGRIGGAIPLRMEDEAGAIDGGLLEAAGPGVLKFESAAARQALSAGGQYADLLFQALTDFRYEKLSLEIDKARAGEGKAVLRTLGRNPAVLDGRPFAVNLNISGNFDRLVTVLTQVLRLPDEIVRSIVPRSR